MAAVDDLEFDRSAYPEQLIDLFQDDGWYDRCPERVRAALAAWDLTEEEAKAKLNAIADRAYITYDELLKEAGETFREYAATGNEERFGDMIERDYMFAHSGSDDAFPDTFWIIYARAVDIDPLVILGLLTYWNHRADEGAGVIDVTCCI